MNYNNSNSRSLSIRHRVNSGLKRLFWACSQELHSIHVLEQSMLMRIKRRGRRTSDLLPHTTINKMTMKMTKTRELSTRYMSVFFKPTLISNKALTKRSSKSNRWVSIYGMSNFQNPTMEVTVASQTMKGNQGEGPDPALNHLSVPLVAALNLLEITQVSKTLYKAINQ